MSGTADFEKWASEKGIVLARHEDGEYLWGPARDAWAAWKYLSESTTLPAHRDDAAVDALAELMKAKLAKQRAKGYGGWDTDCTRERLSELLRGHVDKGDPVDVANFCAFLSSRGEGIAPETSTPTVAQLQARVAELEASSHNYFEERNQARETVRGYQAEAGSLRAALSALVQEYEGYFEGAPEPKSLIDAREVLGS